MAQTQTGESSSSNHYAAELRRIGTDVMDDDTKRLSVQPSEEMQAAAARIGLSPLEDMAGVSQALDEGGLDAAHRYVDGITPQFAEQPDITEQIVEVFERNEREHGPSFRLNPEGKEQLRKVRDAIRMRVANVFKSRAVEDLRSETGSSKSNILIPVALVAAAGLLIAPTVTGFFGGIDKQNRADDEQAKKDALAASILEASTSYSPDEIFVGSGVVGEDGNDPSSVGQAIMERNPLPVDPSKIDLTDGTFIDSSYGPGIVSEGQTIDVVLEDPDHDGLLEPVVQDGELNPQSSIIPAPKTH